MGSALCQVRALLLFTFTQGRAERAESAQEMSALLTDFGLKIRAEYLSSLAGSELHRSISSGQGCLAAGNKECRGFRIPTLLGASLLPPLTKNSPDLRIKGKKKNQCFFFELEGGKKPQIIQQILHQIRVS